jgi:acyl-CoA reductase-like NAD-dependent aldehyde dehydrogenase
MHLMNGKRTRTKEQIFSMIFAQQLRKNKEELARTATNEMGKAIKEARSEVEKCAWAMEYFADNGKIFTTDEVINSDARKTFVTFEPLGVIGSIMPWNFPYWQALRFAAPSLMVGNTIVLKPASATMQCGIEIPCGKLLFRGAKVRRYCLCTGRLRIHNRSSHRKTLSSNSTACKIHDKSIKPCFYKQIGLLK